MARPSSEVWYRDATNYQIFGKHLLVFMTSTLVIGIFFLSIDYHYSPLESLLVAFFSGIGFTITLVIMAGLREKISNLTIPKPFRGLPIYFIIASIISLAYLGFR